MPTASFSNNHVLFNMLEFLFAFLYDAALLIKESTLPKIFKGTSYDFSTDGIARHPLFSDHLLLPDKDMNFSINLLLQLLIANLFTQYLTVSILPMFMD